MKDAMQPLEAQPGGAAGEGKSAPQQWWARFHSRGWLWACLLGLTVVGGFLRFWRLGYQAYWTDEAFTIGRVSKALFSQMLATLTDEQGFPPGWYALLRWWCQLVEWWTRDGGFAFAPESTRFLPAIFGTLTVPAMYFLARQFTGRSGSLLVALLAAVNPFLIYYARDIKMYAALWFFITLNMALFLHWQTTRRHWLWFPLYALSGVAMTSLHAIAWVIVALQLIFLLTRPRVKAWDAPLWLTGVGLMSLLPVWWYAEKATWLERVTDAPQDRGMNWIQIYTDMSWQTVAGMGTSHILGYLWPVYPPSARLVRWFDLGSEFNANLGTRSWGWMAAAQWWVALGVGAILVLGLVPWRGWRRSAEAAPRVTRGRWWWVALWLALPTLLLALTWIPRDSVWFGRVWRGFNPKPMWEPRYLGIIVPAWLLWLGVSLRRLPTWPLRTVAVVSVVGVCVVSSLSNQLVQRNAPFNRVAEVAARYLDRKNPAKEAVAVPSVSYPVEAENAAMTAALRVRPGSKEDNYAAYNQWTTLPTSAMLQLRTARPAQPDWLCKRSMALWLADVQAQPRVKTIVLVDRYGDVNDPADDLSTESLQKRRLGPKWKLVEEQRFTWHYEWRFYLFHTWRIRVWQSQ